MSTQKKLFGVKSIEASRLRQRKRRILDELSVPDVLIGGCLSETHRHCGRSNCHCVEGRGHPLWSITFSRNGQRQVQRVPREFLPEVEQAVLDTQAHLDALKEVMEINLKLLVLTRGQLKKKSTSGSKKVRSQRKKRSPRRG